MKFDFTGRVVLVTGGTRGIGGQLARDYASLGARVVVTGTSGSPADPVPGEYMQADFLDRAAALEFTGRLRELEVDVLVNNAGINRINEIDQVPLEDWDALLAVNLTGAFMTTQAVVPGMKARGYGRIVNIGSVFGKVSRAKRTPYTVTKYGIRGLTTTAAVELASSGILVNTVSPGFVNTELTRRILKPEEMDALAEQVPIGRFADPEEISRVVVFLTSALNTYLTGQNVVVDGGFVHV
jgi:3-oxoacyl-[acyl-carrier protein] reductase